MASALIVSQSGSKPSCTLKIKALSPAKLNLYLNILGRYSKRFNRIESIVERISLCDEITIAQILDKNITIECNRPELATPDNLCVKAARMLQKKFRLNHGFHIELKKNIPVGAGMGGGSSNCASVFIAINQMLQLGLTKEQLYKFGEQLGSDVNFFISESRYAVMEGRGERITPFPAEKFNHIVIFPGIHLPTKLVYQGTHVKLTRFLNNVKIMQNALKHGDAGLASSVNFNVLENSALMLRPVIARVRSALAEQGVYFRITGSGSALYAFSHGARASDVVKSVVPAEWQVFDVSSF